ncbi:hypothetical protein ACFT7S_06360 [Streptomyces sp. NPDC057136]|uniref:hypothetical protein n=1 Tax=Streptomyces sp. NPDC057136 TaxID=3346029 RepID=UPI00363CBA0E
MCATGDLRDWDAYEGLVAGIDEANAQQAALLEQAELAPVTDQDQFTDPLEKITQSMRAPRRHRRRARPWRHSRSGPHDSSSGPRTSKQDPDHSRAIDSDPRTESRRRAPARPAQ